ncbi:MAG TPA: hypothetical protein VFZ66_03130 [Herpetosiphonaceae bacterium]
MPSIGGLSNVWNTIREINVGDIRERAEQPVHLAIIGVPEDRSAVIRALYAGPSRYGPAERAVIREYDVPLPRDRQSEVGRSDLALLVVDARAEVSVDAESVADKLAILAIPRVVLLIGAEQMPRTDGGGMWYLPGALTVFAPDAETATLIRLLAPAVVEQLPDELRVAAARQLPGLRDAVARALVGDSSFSNASYAFTSGLSEMVPVLNIPLNAADMLVLTKNQALLVYKLALAFGAPADFQAQMREVMPVIGSGFLWRQVARQLVGLIPGFGILPKVAVAYAGTYATGQAAAVWYRSGEVLSGDALRGLYKQAIEIGRERARDLIRRRKADLPPTTGKTNPMSPPSKWRRLWPFGRK